jgi:hypothetical protein
MTEALTEALARHHRLLNEVASAVIPAAIISEQASLETRNPAMPVSHAQQRQQTNRQRRQDRYEIVMEPSVPT